jgi:hypothetical protein
VLLTRPPLDQQNPKVPLTPFDLHVLRTPPAFVLSQDQTRHPNISSPFARLTPAHPCGCHGFSGPPVTIVCAKLYRPRLLEVIEVLEAVYSIAHKGSLDARLGAVSRNSSCP